MRLLNFILAVSFLVLASLQVDTDNAVVWILIFGSMAVTCILSIFNFFSKSMLYLLMGMFTGYGVYLWIQDEPHTYLRFNSLTGVVLCLTVVTFQLVRAYRIR
ncbi:MAG: hypothetical protein L6Q51_09775 [Cyclobacteriaceae bacterium]|nr:hypothetical protein [Cyclobacteriaceae bacterium]